MKQITQIGATTQEAVSLALQKLGKTHEQVDVEVLQEGKKGFLGFGSRPAEVRVTVIEVADSQAIEKVDQTKQQLVGEIPTEETVIISMGNEDSQLSKISNVADTAENSIEEAQAYLTTIAEQMGVKDLQIDMAREGKYVLFQLKSEKAALLIGKRGQTLNSLQQLTQLVLNKSAKQFLLVKLDVENYRERRQEALEQLADRMADKAIRLKQRVEFEPMQSYERKVIHNQLANRVDIETYSEGIEPNRYLVIEPLK
ncbi:MAG: RNA-binding cell elongation regulator Jag/EloR [Lysinibacillus sp.]